VVTKVVVPGETSRRIATCQTVFVAVDAEGKPTPYTHRKSE
jgi:acyl-CoA hydrolase